MVGPAGAALLEPAHSLRLHHDAAAASVEFSGSALVHVDGETEVAEQESRREASNGTSHDDGASSRVQHVRFPSDVDRL